MIKKALLMAALALTATIAHADLGDTYAQSCAKYGSSGKVDKQRHFIYWHYGKSTVVEYFVNNECVCMRLLPDKDWSYPIDQIEASLLSQCGSSQSWYPAQIEANDSLGIKAQWATTDSLIIATLYKTGVIQFAYQAWLEKKGLLEGTAPAQTAPVEDEPGIRM